MTHPTLKHRLLLALITALLLVACASDDEEGLATQGNTPASEATIQANETVRQSLPLDDPRDFEDATRGLIAVPQNLRVKGPDAHDDANNAFIWDMPLYSFIEGEAPDTVNPSLWRQERLNNIHGLFQVTPGIYQLRGFDLSNMSIIQGKTGWILVDPLTTKETAAAAIAFAREHLGDSSISAVIFTHSHIDHFGGVLSVLGTNQNTQIIAPIGFMEEATSENVLAGSTMSRRSMYMYGSQLERSARGHVGSGLGKSPAFGSPGIAAPTTIIDTTGEALTIDGVEFVFQNAAGSEAPAELTFYLPELKAFCGAEIVSRNMHNLYTLRGAKVRDARRWSAYIDEAIELFPNMEIYFASHHWPLWGNAAIIDFLKKQRDMYAYIHDQTLRLASLGHTPREIADSLQMPEALRVSFPNRGYYGTVKHNAKAVYQQYFGWYDGNPANLDPLPPSDAAQRYIKLMGGEDAVLNAAESAFDVGDYRWVAELLNHLVFADPDNADARALLAQTYDQLAYQAESGPWRDVYLTGALELRQGPPKQGISVANAVDLLRETPVEQFFSLMAAMLNGPKADGREYVLTIEFTDLKESHTLELENAVLHHRPDTADPSANATIRITHPLFIRMLGGDVGIREILFSDEVSVEGSTLDLVRFFALLDLPDSTFNIVTP
ncbi:MAG: MBL fold metallo-hydrolase [Halioglobus sp.]|nr:MBL fold metallo-hydrolase [Halioglobus sp.]